MPTFMLPKACMLARQAKKSLCRFLNRMTKIRWSYTVHKWLKMFLEMTTERLYTSCFCILMGIPVLQVNLFQKLLFLHQLTHIMTTDCSFNYKFNSWKFQAQNMGRTCCVSTEIVSDIQNNFCTQHVLPMFCKKKSFWQRFTCTIYDRHI